MPPTDIFQYYKTFSCSFVLLFSNARLQYPLQKNAEASCTSLCNALDKPEPLVHKRRFSRTVQCWTKKGDSASFLAQMASTTFEKFNGEGMS